MAYKHVMIGGSQNGRWLTLNEVGEMTHLGDIMYIATPWDTVRDTVPAQSSMAKSEMYERDTMSLFDQRVNVWVLAGTNKWDAGNMFAHLILQPYQDIPNESSVYGIRPHTNARTPEEIEQLRNITVTKEDLPDELRANNFVARVHAHQDKINRGEVPY